jgi:HK97 family phage major capsid protein
MNRLKDIETRMAAIAIELEADGADVEKLIAEVKSLKEERKGITDQAEKRSNLIKEIAEGAGTPIVGVLPVEERKIETMGIDSKEYRSAFLRKLQGHELTDIEKRSIAATNVSGAIPTQTSDMIMTKLRQVAPLLGEVTLLNVAGNVTFAVEGTNNAAALHTENAGQSAQADTLVSVSLGGFEITKLVRISQTVRTMSINSFESWLSDLIAENIAVKIEAYIILGTGSSQPKGVDYARTWTDTSTAVQWAAASPTYAEITEQVGLLSGGYYRGAKWLMNHKTFWTNIQAIRDDSKAPIVKEMGDKYYILGKEVLFSDYVNDGDVFLGDFKKIVANLAQDIVVKSSEHSGFTYNAIDYLGAAIFDCDIAIPEAFVKGAAALTAG